MAQGSRLHLLGTVLKLKEKVVKVKLMGDSAPPVERFSLVTVAFHAFPSRALRPAREALLSSYCIKLVLI